MKVPVQLYVQAKMGDGSHPCLKAAMLPNGPVRPGYAIKEGTEDRGRVYHPQLPRGRQAHLGTSPHRLCFGASEAYSEEARV
jgi:hypothetical protein